MKRTVVLVAALFFAFAGRASAQTTDDTGLLLQRLASQLGGLTEVVIGKLPIGVPNIPLPSAAIIGGTHRTIRSSNRLEIYDVYYLAAPGAYKAYATALATAGWTSQPERSGGFESSNSPTMQLFCKTGDPALITVRQEADPTDLRVSVAARENAPDLTCEFRPMNTFTFDARPTGVPELRAPQGVTVEPGGLNFSENGGQTSARIGKASAADALLDDFASQLTTSGWEAGNRLTSKNQATQTFTRVDAKKVRWQCVLLIAAINGKPGDFFAFEAVERTN